MKLRTGDPFPLLELVDIDGRPIQLPPRFGLVHLQLRRFAGCPVCNVHLRALVRRRDDLTAAGVQEAMVFHSPAHELRRYVQEVPFQLIADPAKRLYRALGAEAGVRSIADPRAWPGIIRAVFETFTRWTRGIPAPLLPSGGPLQLPAEFLVAADGTIVAAKYGEHVDDQWTVDELLALAGSTPRLLANNATAPSRGEARGPSARCRDTR